MAILKCKMCGGDLSITEGMTVAECEYCGSMQTVPTVDNEKKLTLFARANRLRAGCEFDKAAGVYETIVADFPEEAEAYWGLVLCKYGIEYVDDPATGKKIPTCHRSSFNSVMEDNDFEQALENADVTARKVYREEAKQIEELRRGIIAVSANERPYDIFICYKETDENGERTLDSVLAQDIYDALTGKGYRVFFSRITLEDKLGVEYEPYIFAALNSAKVMLAVGTDYEYYNAVWVKNEWSRYLKLMEQDKSKHLIPCFKGIDAYDMPREFARLQAQDLGKVGAIQDLLRGIEKLLPREASAPVVQETVPANSGDSRKLASLLDRGNMALEDGDWEKADSFFEEVLNNDSKNAQAYLGKTLVEEKCRTIDAFVRKRKDMSENADDADGETLQLQPDEKHIDAAVEHFLLHGYVTEDSIRRLYQFDLSYHSEVKERQRQYQNEEKYWTEHKWLSRAEKFASGTFAEDLGRQKKRLFTALTERVKKAQGDETAEITRVQEAYARHLKQADAQAEALYQKGVEQQPKDAENRAKHHAELQTRNAELEAKKSELKEMQQRLKQWEVVYEKNKSKIFGREAQLKKDADAEIARLKLEIERLKRESGELNRQVSYLEAVMLMDERDTVQAAMALAKVDYKDSEERSKALWNEIAVRESVSAGFWHTVGLKPDGTVVAVGGNKYGECTVAGWKNIVSVSAGDAYTVGLKSDGTVVAVGRNYYGQCNVSGWADIVSVFAGNYHTVGLKSDGTVVAVGRNNEGQCNVSDWRDIVAVTAGISHTVCLKSDGTVAAVGRNDGGRCNVSDWTDIVAVTAGIYHTVGLKSDGTVAAVGRNDGGRCNVSDWTDIVSVSAGIYHTVGLKSDGTVVAVGNNNSGQCDVSDWKNIKLPKY